MSDEVTITNEGYLEVWRPSTPVEIHDGSLIKGHILSVRVRLGYVQYEIEYYSNGTRQIELFDVWQIKVIEDAKKYKIGFGN